jgi:CheY-like chemotaxis protein
VEIVADVPDGVAAIDAARALQPDVAVLDAARPGANGLAATPAIKQHVLKQSSFDGAWTRSTQRRPAIDSSTRVSPPTTWRVPVRQLRLRDRAGLTRFAIMNGWMHD